MPSHLGIRAAVQTQLDIGPNMLVRGFIARAWTELLTQFSVKYPASTVSGWLKSLWLDFTDKLWRERNELAHKNTALSKQQEERTLSEPLNWYRMNSHILAKEDQFLLRYNTEDIQRMPSVVREHLVLKSLDTARDVAAKERLQREKGQRVITQYFRRRQGVG